MILVMAVLALPDDWTVWRGPSGNGISAENVKPWGADGPKTAWKADVGVGFSSFVVGGGRAYTIGWADENEHVFALDVETGKVVWTHAWPSDLGDKYFEGGPCSTPTLDGDRLYVLGRWGELFQFDAATGKIAWSKNLQKETKARIPDWGFSGSPRPYGDLLLITMAESGVAVEKKSGRIVWSSKDGEAGYSTPTLFKHDGRELALFSSGKHWIAADPRTGQEAWRFPWLTQYGVNAADPIVDGDRVFVSSAYGKGCGVFKLGGGAPVWTSKVLSIHMAPPILIDGHLYGVDGMGGKPSDLKCVELASGEEKWAFPGLGCGTVAAAGRTLVVLSEKGELLLAPASTAGFQPSARAKILDGRCWTPPVLANGRLFARTAAGDVVCLDLRK